MEINFSTEIFFCNEKERRRQAKGVNGNQALYVYKGPYVTIRQDLMDCNVESVSVQIKAGHYRPFIVTSLYRPPGKPVSHFQDI